MVRQALQLRLVDFVAEQRMLNYDCYNYGVPDDDGYRHGHVEYIRA